MSLELLEEMPTDAPKLSFTHFFNVLVRSTGMGTGAKFTIVHATMGEHVPDVLFQNVSKTPFVSVSQTGLEICAKV